MEEKNVTAPVGAKPSYEELEKQLYQVVDKCKTLYGQLQEANMFNTFKRLDYCFKVVENSGHFDPEFVNYCKTDIVNIMTISETPTDNKEE